MMAYTVVRGCEATPADVEGVIALDRLCLDARYQVTAEQDRALFRRNRECCFIVRERENGTIVAYLMVLPVREDVYEAIRSGRFVDTALTPDMIVSLDHPCECRMYFASVVIHPEKRSLQLVRMLLDRMFADFADLAERGIWVKSVTTDEINPNGVKMGRLLGLTEVCRTNHGSGIYEVRCVPPEFRPVVPSARRFAATAGATALPR